MKVITNCDMKKPINCSKLYPEDSMIMGAGNGEALRPMKEMDFVQPAPSNNVYKSKARTDFRETWLWQLQPVGDHGKSISVTIPDTITEWKASMFCTASIGFGLADTVSVITFKPFFVEPALPYSMIRGESIDLKVKVFNYLKDCIMVRVSLANSNDFVAVPCAQCQYTTCLCENEDKTVSWSVTPKSLGVVKFTVSAEAIQTNQRCGSKIPVVPKEGKIDTVIKSVLVEPEGVLVELSKSSLICANDTPVKEDVVLQPPADAIAGSARAEVFVIGDIMGSAMQNLDKLLAMPYGCGEQNMLGLSVDISVLQYLKATNQLTDEIKANGITFLESGYQKELTYKHDDCSFSAFGNSDTTGGSLWLTAFVVSQLGKAADFTFIDSNVIQCAVQWISQHQLGNGCFKSTGNLYHTSMKGGVNDDVSLSAYVCYSLQELPNPTTEIDSLISSSLQCLRNELPNVTNPYTMALLANVFRNPEDATYRQALLDKLDQLATKQAGMIHWKTSQSSGPSSHPYWDPAPSAQVELAGYVMLAYLSKPSVSASDIGYVSAIARWMVKQQGPYGGFETTQDTVVGFAALAKYAALVSGGTLQATVKIFKGQLVLATLQVTNANRLLLQQRSLKDIPGNYTIEVTGKGCVFVQRILRYNIHPRNSQTTFTIQVKTDSPKCAPVSQFNIGIAVSYRGSRNATNMVLIEVKILSGFSPDADSLEQVLEKPLVKQVDYNNQLVTIYLDELLQQQTVEYAILVNQDFAVSNQQPAAVKVYDYYKPEENAVTEYNTPCKKGI